MKNLTKTSIVSAVVVALIGVSAVSASARGQGGLDFAAVDTNSDGFLTIEELKAERDKRFDGMDTNKDGALSVEEMKAHRSQKREKGMNSKKLFERIDADENGSISEEEFAAAMEKRRGMWGKHGGKHGGKYMGKHGGKHMGKHNGGMGGKDHERGPKGFMKQMDSDGDGKISKAEMTGKFVERIMEHLDTDNDNRISKAEADAAHGKFGKHD